MKCAMCKEAYREREQSGSLETIETWYDGKGPGYTAYKVHKLDLCPICIEKVERFIYNPECYQTVS